MISDVIRNISRETLAGAMALLRSAGLTEATRLQVESALRALPGAKGGYASGTAVVRALGAYGVLKVGRGRWSTTGPTTSEPGPASRR